MLERARAMRREQTPAERAMWRLLRSRGFERLKFRRQVPLGSYIVDFVCLDPRVVVECDGGQHADNAYDVRRDAWLRQQGFRVLRVWNNDVLEEPEGVDAMLRDLLKRP
ncbi:MAG: endonuclease domain-containing protein [Caulobacteraceae bacterium]